MSDQVELESPASSGTGSVLLTLASAQFLMTLDSSVMNVSIATVSKDVGTTVTGIQTAITLYTLVMASLMITGGKLGQIMGRKRALVHRLDHLRVRLAHHRARHRTSECSSWVGRSSRGSARR